MRKILSILMLAGFTASGALADVINGNSEVFHSQGTQTGTSYTLGNSFRAGTTTEVAQNGYVGTYIDVTQAGPVSFTVNASGAASNSIDPDMTLSIANSNQSFTVTPGSSNDYTMSATLQPGTYFIRTQLDNSNNIATPALTVNNLTVSGATISNSDTAADSSENALDAANTYIQNYRQGTNQVQVLGANNQPLPQGTQVTMHMLRNAFNFGSNVAGTSLSDINNELGSNPATGSTGAIFQNFLNKNFNMIVPSNVGKWGETEATSGNLSMQAADVVLNYAANNSNDMTARMHNLIWGAQQPTFINTDLTNAQSTNTTTKTNGLNALNAAILSRINNYYVSGNGTGSEASQAKVTINGQQESRDLAYTQLDVLNESLHTTPYWKVLGASGTALVYKEVQNALAADGANVELETNEFNVLQNSPATVNGTTGAASGSDAYANWYRKNVEDINNAGQGKVVTGIGVQDYVTSGYTNTTVMRALESLDIEGLPIGLNEFGIQNTDTSDDPAKVVTNLFTMMFGNPNANTAMIWGWLASETGNAELNSVLVNADGSLTDAGVAFQNLIQSWRTGDVTYTVGANGMIDMSGFYGDYAAMINGQQVSTLDFEAPEPALGATAIMIAGTLCGMRRSRRGIAVK